MQNFIKDKLQSGAKENSDLYKSIQSFSQSNDASEDQPNLQSTVK